MSKEMNNRRKFQEAFGEIHASEQLKNRVLETCRSVGQERMADIKTKNKFRFRRAAIAAAAFICLILGTSAVAAANGFSFIELFQSKSTLEESNYSLPVTIELVPTDYFSGQIEEVKNIVLKQIKDYEPWMSTLPESYYKSFDSVEDALAYIGVSEIEHPLAGENAEVGLHVLCNQDGEIVNISLLSAYDDINGNLVQICYNIYTELTDGEAIADAIGQSAVGDDFFDSDEYSRIPINESALRQNKKNYVTINVDCAASEYIEYAIEAQTLGSGMEAPVITSSEFDSGVKTMECFFAKGAVLYSINVVSDEGDIESLKVTMDEILKLY